MPNRLIHESARFSKSLAALSHGAERMFWRLTTVADDFGRFNAEPAAIVAMCFPLMIREITDKQVDTWLSELADASLIKIYMVAGSRFGCFLNWSKYQQTRAKKSKFPDPLASDSNCNQMSADVAEKNNERSDSDTTTTTTSISKQEGESEGEPKLTANGNGNGHHQAPEPLKPEELLEAWNDHCGPLGLAKVRELTPSRRKQVLLRLHEHPEIDFWQVVFGNIRGSPLLRGLKPPKRDGDRPWRADFDWLIKNDTNAVKVREGKYLG